MIYLMIVAAICSVGNIIMIEGWHGKMGWFVAFLMFLADILNRIK